MTKEKMQSTKIPGYNLVSTTCAAPNKGGLAIYALEGIGVRELKKNTVKNTEACGVQIVGTNLHTFKEKIDVWNVYSRHDRIEAKATVNLINKLYKSKQNKIVIAGDLNCDLRPGADTKTYKLQEALEDLYLDDKISILNNRNQPTYKSGTVIDVALTMGNINQGFAEPISVDLQTDHYPLIIGIHTGEQLSQTHTTETNTKFKRDEKTSLMLKNQCKQLKKRMYYLSVDKIAKAIISIWQTAKKKPAKSVKKKKKRNRWWNEEINELYLKKQKHLNTYGRDETFTQINDELQEEIKKAKNKSFAEFASQLNHRYNRNVYHAIKNVGQAPPAKFSNLTIKTKEGELISDTQSKVDHLSRWYQTPLGKHPPKSKQRRKILKSRWRINFLNHPPGEGHSNITITEVKIAKTELSNNKAPGPSNITKEDLDIVGEDIYPIIQFLANKICKTGVWPQTLKKANICPIPKGKQKDSINIDQTRPISLLEIIDKWLQKIMYNRIINDIHYHNTQAGYSLSCEYHTTLMSDHIHANEGRYNLAVFTDISKAFDSVPIPELIDAIWATNIHPVFKHVITSFAQNRYYRVLTKGTNGQKHSSKWRKMIYGTPQGSILGPLLWNIFFDPLLQNLANCAYHIPNKSLNLAYCDDLTLIETDDNPTEAEKRLEAKLEIFSKFLQERGMTLATDKLKCMCIDKTLGNYEPTIMVDDQKVKPVKKHKFLGVWYDQKFCFVPQYREIIEKINGRLKAMKALVCASWGPTLATTKILHHCYIESIIRNGLLAWYPYLNKEWRDSIASHYRKSIRIAYQFPINTWIKAMMNEAEIDTVDEIAMKCAISLYTRLNPENPNVNSQTKEVFLSRTPTWMKIIEHVPAYLWKGQINNKPKEKKILTNDKIKFHTNTLESQKQVDEIESQHNTILYTDASVNLESNPPGQASVAYCWYQKIGNVWQPIKHDSANIGVQHSSYSAEAAALTIALKHCPPQCNKFAVFSDSMSNIKALDKGIATSTEQHKLFSTLDVVTQKVDFYHVKAHTNITRNNEVDAMCDINKNIDKPILQEWNGQKTTQKVKNWVNNWIRTTNLTKILQDHDAITRNSKTLELLKTTLYVGDSLPRAIPSLHRHLTRKQGVLIAQCRLNRYPMCKWFLQWIKRHHCILCKAEKDLCVGCSELAKCETCIDPKGKRRTDEVVHVLDQCTRHEKERQDLVRKIGYFTDKPTALLYSRQPDQVKALAVFIESVDTNRRAEESKKLEEKRLKLKETKETEK